MAPKVAVLALRAAEIVIAERIGLFWPDKAAAIGALMARDGQNEPIKVVWNAKASHWVLVAGLHRLRGAMMAGMTTIDAIEVKGKADDLRLIEASENVHRREFGPLERSLFIKALADIVEKRWSGDHDGLSAQQIGQIKRWERDRQLADGIGRADEMADSEAGYSCAILCGTMGWQEEAAESLGFSRRTLQSQLRIHRQLIAPFDRAFLEAFAATPHGENGTSLEALCRIIDTPMRGRVMALLVENPALSVDQAKVAAGARIDVLKVRVSGDTKFMNNAGANLDRLSAAGWRSFASVLAEKVKAPALFAVRDALNARIAELGVEQGDD